MCYTRIAAKLLLFAKFPVNFADTRGCSCTPSGGCVVGRCWEASVLLMGSSALVWSLLMARWIGSKAYTSVYFLYIEL